MRVDVKKILFFGAKNELSHFFDEAQEAGLIHFIETSATPKETPQEIHDTLQAVKILRGLPVLDQEQLGKLSEAKQLVQTILDLKNTIDKQEEEERVCLLEIERIRPFGNFSFEDIAYIEEKGERKVQFFFSKKGALETLPPHLIFVGSEHALDYFVSIEKGKVQPDKLIEMRFEASLGKLVKRRQILAQEIKRNDDLLKSYQKYSSYLHLALIDIWDHFALDSAKVQANAYMEGRLFAIEGWVPKTKLQELEKKLAKTQVEMEQIAIEATDTIPTYLENKGIAKAGQDLISIYDTPSHEDKDPSLWVLFSFALFFAMIIGDGGYGLVFLGIAIYVRYKMALPTDLGKRMVNLFTLLCLFCVGWGVLTNSFFGISINWMGNFSVIQWLVKRKAAYHFDRLDQVYNYWMDKYPSITNATSANEFLQGAVKPSGELEMVTTFTSNIMMELALLIGSIHVICSLLRYVRRNFAAIGWVLFIIGAYFYIPYYLKATSIIHLLTGADVEYLAFNGQVMMSVGLVLALTLSFIQNRIMGLLEITNIIQIFSDILSYLRLYALGLAGAIISLIVNDVAGKMFFFGGALIFILGHLLNMVLAVIGGVIHGLRLNFIEWYHYSFEGGGKRFSPLKKKSTRRTI